MAPCRTDPEPARVAVGAQRGAAAWQSSLRVGGVRRGRCGVRDLGALFVLLSLPVEDAVCGVGPCAGTEEERGSSTVTDARIDRGSDQDGNGASGEPPASVHEELPAKGLLPIRSALRRRTLRHLRRACGATRSDQVGTARYATRHPPTVTPAPVGRVKRLSPRNAREVTCPRGLPDWLPGPLPGLR